MLMLLLRPEILTDRKKGKKQSKAGRKGVGKQPDNLI